MPPRLQPSASNEPPATNLTGVTRTRLFHWDLPHPILIASGPLTNHLRTINKMFQAGAAGVVTKTITPIPDERRCRCMRSRELLLNREGYSQRSVEDWEIDLAALRGRPVIANIVADTPDDLAALARRVTAAGAEALELGLSCPTLEDDPVCCFPDKLYDFCLAVRRAVDVPLLVKLLLATSVKANRDMVRAVRDAGADGISLADTLPSLFIDKSGSYALGGPGGLSGGFLKPLVLKSMYDVRDIAGDRLVFVGIGGILTAEDALDYIRMGCSAVQVCTLVMNESYHAIEPLVQRLQLVVSSGTTPVMEMKGSAVPPAVTEGLQ